MKKLAIIILLAVGCGGGASGELEKLKDEACACKDKACATEVNKKIDAAIEKMGDKKEPDEATMKVLMEAGMCLMKHE
jgi:hypothetical protein